MGYGHLRAASAVADALGTHVSASDAPPLAAPSEIKTWTRLRVLYERLCRVSQRRLSGYPAQRFLDWITQIPPLHPERDLSAPTRSAQTMERLAAQGFGRTLVTHLEQTGQALVSAYYAEPIVADRAGRDRVFCVVTDSDVNRVWAPFRPQATGIRYLVPTRRVARRLHAYGVPTERVEVTGFPLPPALVGQDGGDLRRNLAARLVRLDPKSAFRERLDAKELRALLPHPREMPTDAVHVVFAVGGAGAQTDLVKRFLPALGSLLDAGRLRLTLVAGTRREVGRQLERRVAEAGLGPHACVNVLCRDDFSSYYTAFNDLLAGADVLWTKPSELVFYAALGLPLVLSEPVGVQEIANARWVLAHGAAIRQGKPEHAHSWLMEHLEDGHLAGAAWSGYVRLPHDGALRIRRAVENA